MPSRKKRPKQQRDLSGNTQADSFQNLSIHEPCIVPRRLESSVPVPPNSGTQDQACYQLLQPDNRPTEEGGHFANVRRQEGLALAGTSHSTISVSDRAQLHQGDRISIEHATFVSCSNYGGPSVVENPSTTEFNQQKLKDEIGLALRIVGMKETRNSRIHMKRCISLLGFRDKLYARSKHSVIEERFEKEYIRAETRCRDSFAFGDLMVREDTIEAPEKDTCHWIYDTQEYSRWRSEKSSILWIKGESSKIMLPFATEHL